jgi:RND family efflux transporter MFP subunit
MKTPQKIWKLTALLAALLLAGGAAGCKKEQNKIDLPVKSAKAAEPSKTETAAKASTTDESGAEPVASASPGSAFGGGVAEIDGAASARRFSGSFEPQRVTDVAASVPGIITEVYVVEGQRVEKGDRLINIDSQNYRLQVAQAEAVMKAAQARVDTLQVEFDRATTLRKQEAIAASQVDQLTGQLAAARAQLQQAKVGLRMARKARGDAMIRAPYAGVITQVNVAEGDYAAPGPMALVRLSEVQKLYLRVHVPEQYSTVVDEGDMLEVRVAALDKTLKLPVARINPIISAKSRAFDVLAELDNPELEIRSGMYAQVSLADAPLAAGEEGPAKTASAENASAETASAKNNAPEADEGEK